jgi:hypothetical protein
LIPESSSSGPKTLTDFCRVVIGRNAVPWPPPEETLSAEFIRFYELASSYGRASIEEFVRSLGVQVSDESLPTQLAGCNIRVGEKRKILLSDNGAYVLSREHTLLHEVREMIEYEFRDLGWPIFTQSDQETRAERFAISVRVASVSDFWMAVVDGGCSSESKWHSVGTLILAMAGLVVSGFCLLMPPAYENDQLKRQNQEARMPSRQLKPVTS